jgi:hypothetical protein
MKTTILSLLFLSFSPLTFAEKLDNPCAGLSCTEKMLSISQEFISADGLDAALIPFVASGECYHLIWNLNPNTVHYGYVLVDSKENNFYMGGQFSFFTKSNPYSAYTVQEAQEKNPGRFEENKKLLMERTYSFVDMNTVDPTNPWKYWLKANGDTLLVIAHWGPDQKVFCKFSKHQ